jgi:sulfate permease, SulP family
VKNIMTAFTKPGDLLDPQPFDTASGAQSQPGGLGVQLSSSLDASLSTLPIALVGVVIVYSVFPASYLASGVFATLLALAAVHFMGATSSRPMMYSARIFESTALAAILHSMQHKLPTWGVAESPAVLLAVMCVIGVLAYVSCLLLYLGRADRFTRLIPAPVYAGFAISIAILLILSQSQQISRLVQSGHPLPALASICAVTVAVALLSRHFKPRWPATALGLLAGATAGLAWMAAGVPVVTFMTGATSMWQLPVEVADFQALLAPGVNRKALATSVLASGGLIGLMVFINMSVANEAVSQLDDRYATRRQQIMLSITAMAGAVMGSAPLASSQQVAAAALRTGVITCHKCYFVGLICLLAAITGLLNHVALAALAAIMMVDAFFMADRAALKLGWQWLRGKPLDGPHKEDLALIVIVALCAVVLNAVVAVLAGLMLGLLLFALRNAKKPVRAEWTGAQLHSNSARSRIELSILAGLGSRIRVLELETELFFGCVSSLDQCLRQSLESSQCVILDWSRVRHVDSSIALSIQRWQRQAQMREVITMHAAAGQTAGNADVFLTQYLPEARRFADLDRALEAAEALVMDSYAQPADQQARMSEDNMILFKGLDSEQQELLQSMMPKRFVSAGDAVFETGQSSDSMYLVLHGVAEVIARNEQGALQRLASVGRGHVFGEVGFLDRAQRTATLVARNDLTLAEMTRSVFERLRRDKPDIVLQLLTNLTLDMATRLRHTTQAATARQRAG